MEDNDKSLHREFTKARRFSLFSKPLSTSVEQVVKPVYKKHGFAESRILTQWQDIVGSELAAYSIPQKLIFPRGKKEDGTLHVLVASGRALELQHMQPVILDKITMYFGYPAVTRLQFMQAGQALFRRELKEKLKCKPEPDAGVVALVAECEDPELRSALLSLGAAITAVEN